MDFTEEGNTIRLSGDITVDTVTIENYTRLMQQLLKETVTSLDLTQVGQADSTCVALLVSAKRVTDNRSISIKHAPKVVAELLPLYQLEKWIVLS